MDHLAAVKKAEQELAQAHRILDLETIERLLHPDYVIVQPGGRIETKAEVLASYRSGDRAEGDHLDIRLHGNTAIVTGRWQASGENEGEPFDYAACFLSVWLRESGHLQYVAYQSTEVNDPK